MALWGWLLIAAGAGTLVGLEAWAWTRHGTSAIGLTVAGGISGAAGLVGVALAVIVIGSIPYGIFAAATGIDPLGFNSSSASSAASGSRDSHCDPSYEGACLDPDSADYDCEGGSGDGPDYTGAVMVVGDDHFGLDRDGDGAGCQ
jgi:hypothetical protein